jgi:hypothetical protein
VSDSDVDPAELRRHLSDIKGAMGLDERYPGQRRMWLVYGVVIGGVSILTNATFVIELPNAGYILAWFGMVAVVGLAQWKLVSGAASERPTTGPNWWVLVGSLAVGLIGLWIALGDVIATSTAGAARGAQYFSHVLIFLGLGFLLTGNLLRTVRIRRRDRIPFYVGGVWMLVLASLLPHVEVLQYWGYAVFGVLFLGQALASYALTGPE